MYYRLNFKKYRAYTAQRQAEAQADFRIVQGSITVEALERRLRERFPEFYPTSNVPPS